MPYIKQEDRAFVDYEIKTLANEIKRVINDSGGREGMMNYVISQLINQVYDPKTMRYSDMNDVVGMLDCCKMEFYRKVAAPYEDKKELENGKVY